MLYPLLENLVKDLVSTEALTKSNYGPASMSTSVIDFPLGACNGLASTSTLDVFTAGYALAGLLCSCFPTLSSFAIEGFKIDSTGARPAFVVATLGAPVWDVELHFLIMFLDDICLVPT